MNPKRLARLLRIRERIRDMEKARLRAAEEEAEQARAAYHAMQNATVGVSDAFKATMADYRAKAMPAHERHINATIRQASVFRVRAQSAEKDVSMMERLHAKALSERTERIRKHEQAMADEWSQRRGTASGGRSDTGEYAKGRKK